MTTAEDRLYQSYRNRRYQQQGNQDLYEFWELLSDSGFFYANLRNIQSSELKIMPFSEFLRMQEVEQEE